MCVVPAKVIRVHSLSACIAKHDFNYFSTSKLTRLYTLTMPTDFGISSLSICICDLLKIFYKAENHWVAKRFLKAFQVEPNHELHDILHIDRKLAHSYIVT